MILINSGLGIKGTRRRILAALLIAALVTPALAGPTRCTTYEEKTLGRLQTVCSDGTRAVHSWNNTLSRWESTITPPPGQTCTRRRRNGQSTLVVTRHGRGGDRETGALSN